MPPPRLQGRRSATACAACIEDAATCEQAAALFGSSPVASSNFVVVADVKTAAVLWQSAGAM
jgi:hypothetical protein